MKIGVGQLSASKNIKKITPCYYCMNILNTQKYGLFKEVNEATITDENSVIVAGEYIEDNDGDFYIVYDGNGIIEKISLPKSIDDVVPYDEENSENELMNKWSIQMCVGSSDYDSAIWDIIGSYGYPIEPYEVYNKLINIGLCKIEDGKYNIETMPTYDVIDFFDNVELIRGILNKKIEIDNTPLPTHVQFNNEKSDWKDIISLYIESFLSKKPDDIFFEEQADSEDGTKLLVPLSEKYKDMYNFIINGDYNGSFDWFVNNYTTTISMNEDEIKNFSFEEIYLNHIQFECQYIEYYEEGLYAFVANYSDEQSSSILENIIKLNAINNKYGNNFWVDGTGRYLYFGNKAQYNANKRTALRMDEDSYDIVKRSEGTIEDSSADNDIMLASYAIGQVLFGKEFMIDFNNVNGFTIRAQSQNETWED